MNPTGAMTSNGNTPADLELDVKIEDPSERHRARRQRQQQQQAATNRTALGDASGGGGGGGDGDENIDEMEEEVVLKYGAAHVIKLFIPVTLCLIFVILSLSLIKSYQKSDGATLYDLFSRVK